LAAAVATFASRAGAGLDSLRPTPGPT
jgi:hypothetical protein